MVVRDGLGRGDRAARRWRRSTRAASASAWRRSGSTGRSRRRRWSRRCPRPCAAIAVLDRTKEPGSIGEPLFLDVRRGAERGARGRRAGSDAAGRRRPLRPVVEGVHPGHGRRRVRRARRASSRGAGSRSASTTTSPARASTTTRRWTSSRPRRCARSSSASARTGRSARTRTRSRSSAPRRACTRRATSSTTRRSPARRPSRTSASGRSRSARRTSSSRRASSAATSSGCSSGWTCSAVRRTARRCCSTAAHPPDEVWDALSRPVQEQILAKRIDVYAIDASRIAREVGLAGRTNIVLQTCFFAISGVLPREQAIERIKAAIAKTYGRRGAEVVERNQAAVDRALDGLHRVEVPEQVTAEPRAAAGRASARARVRPHRHRGDDGRAGRRPAGQRAAGRRHVSERHGGVREAQHLGAGRGLGLRPLHPVRQLQLRLPAQRDPLERTTTSPPGGRTGRVPVGSARGRRPARRPVHAAGLRRGLHRLRAVRRGLPGRARRATPAARRSTSQPREPLVAAERENIAFFETLPASDRSRVDFGTVRGTQFLEPLFEFSGACAGCGETPYLKLLSQLFGDRLMVANATGCSSIYGGNLPTTPWTADADGRGPAWSNSLFEDNAEFGLGFRLAADRHTELARRRLAELRDAVGAELVDEILAAPQLRRVGAASAARAGGRAASGGSTSWTAPASTTCAAWSTTSSGAACGSSAATAGPTTSAPAGSTTSWRAGATSTCSCSTPRSTPTPAARCRRRRRSARSRSSPPPARPCPRRTSPCRRSRTATSTSPGSRWAPIPSRHWTAFREAEAYDGPSLVHRLQPLHRARHRDAQRARPAVPRRRQRLLAADPLRPGGPGGRRQPVPARLAATAHPARRLHQPRAALPHAARTPTRPRPSGCTGWPSRRSTSAGTCTRRWRPAARSDSRPTRARIADGPFDPLHGPHAAQPARRVGVPALADRGRRAARWPTPASARSSSTRSSRSSCAARRPRTRGWSTPAPRASPSRSPTSRPSPRRRPGHAPLPEPARARGRRRRRPGDRQPQRRHARAAGPTTPGRCRTPAPPRSS